VDIPQNPVEIEIIDENEVENHNIIDCDETVLYDVPDLGQVPYANKERGDDREGGRI
jgi:hypothetical protein